MLNISGALVLLPAGFVAGANKGIAGFLQAQFAISGGGASVSANREHSDAPGSRERIPDGS